eukprot:6066172-Pyramimonas_sp.AAC.1
MIGCPPPPFPSPGAKHRTRGGGAGGARGIRARPCTLGISGASKELQNGPMSTEALDENAETAQ